MTTYPPPPFLAEGPLPPVPAGEPSTEKPWGCFYPAWGPAPATLTISQDWDGATHRTYRAYTVRAHWGNTGCAVMLERSPADLEALAPGADRQAAYSIWLAPRGSECTCRGFILGADAGRPCKHISALAAVAAAGLLRGPTNGERKGSGGEADPRVPRPGRGEN